MSVEERAADIKTRLRNDMAKTLRQYIPEVKGTGFSATLDALMEDALHQIEPLLIETDLLIKHTKAVIESQKYAGVVIIGDGI